MQVTLVPQLLTTSLNCEQQAVAGRVIATLYVIVHDPPYDPRLNRAVFVTLARSFDATRKKSDKIPGLWNMPETDANAPAGGKVPIAGGIDLFGKYEVGKLLGCGAFAKVYRARDTRTGKSVAIKAVSKQKLLKNGLSGGGIKREISIMRRLRHPHIVRLHEVLATKTKVYFVMEYAKSGELFTRVARGRFTEELSRRYFQQLISAVGFCHSLGVFHRDLKPENLLLDENSNLKVSDFGLSAVAEQIRPDGLLHTLCGTPAYVAPEILAKKGYDGAKVDVWSCGVVLYVLAAGYLPFNDTNLMAMYRKIYEGQYRCPRWTSPELRRFLSRLLDPNPENRITVHDIVSDPWFTKGYIETKFKFYGESEEDETFESKGHGHGHSEGGSNKCLNAFDIISFSPGLDLSVLFEGSGSVTGGERFVSEESPEKILEKVEEIALAESVTVAKGRGWGLKLEAHDGTFTVLIEVYRLTDHFSVVEMMTKRGGGAVDSQKNWEDRVRPLIRRLIHQPEVPVSRP